MIMITHTKMVNITAVLTIAGLAFLLMVIADFWLSPIFACLKDKLSRLKRRIEWDVIVKYSRIKAKLSALLNTKKSRKYFVRDESGYLWGVNWAAYKAHCNNITRNVKGVEWK